MITIFGRLVDTMFCTYSQRSRYMITIYGSPCKDNVLYILTKLVLQDNIVLFTL